MSAQASPNSVQRFEQLNNGRGPVCFRKVTIAGQPALIGIDTGCERCAISKQFLQRFVVPAHLVQSVKSEVDHGGQQNIHSSEVVTLPLLIGNHNVTTSWIVLPRLAAPIDALVSWSWLCSLKVVLDCELNDMVLKEPPPSVSCVPLSYCVLQEVQPVVGSQPKTTTPVPIY